MKQLIILFSVVLTTLPKLNAQTEYKHLFTKDGVEFAYKENSSNLRQIDLKVTNTRYTKVEVSFTNLQWIANNANVVGKSSGSSFTLKAGEEQHGERDGLWFQCPANYTASELTFRLLELNIKSL